MTDFENKPKFSRLITEVDTGICTQKKKITAAPHWEIRLVNPGLRQNQDLVLNGFCKPTLLYYPIKI